MAYDFLFRKGPKQRECPDERLELNVVPLRIAELKRNPYSDKNQKRINALLTRLGLPPEGSTRQEKKAFVSRLKPVEMDGSVELATPVGLIPNNVYASLTVNANDEKRGYGYKQLSDGSLESALKRLGLQTA